MDLWGTNRKEKSEVRSISKDRIATSEIADILKGIEDADAKAQKARKAGQYEPYLNHLKERLRAVEKLERYSTIRRLDSERECAELSKVLESAEKDYKTKTKVLEDQEKRLILMAHNQDQRSQIRNRFADMRKGLNQFRLRIEHLRTAVRALRTHMREDSSATQERYRILRRVT
jgi:hypothetical protein